MGHHAPQTHKIEEKTTKLNKNSKNMIKIAKIEQKYQNR
jgi:hypothetical protein